MPIAVAGVPDVIDFNFHVKPLLSDRCFKCHGPDDRARKASLRLDVREVAFGELPSGRRAVVAGDTGRSELVRRILSTDPKVMMPAPDSHLALTDVERAILVRWVEQGAEWKPHWAFIPPTRPAPPKTRTDGWARNDIDRFVLATLESHGLSPSAEAPRETLLRRVAMDLTGLPPTLADIDAFVADQSPDAYERVVDRLLASPAYGERMAVEWLDVARYADSHGYQDDGMRTMWPWRDWVIGAFNRNLPLDQFVTWQLAGDLLPSATDEQRLATGFNRNHMQSQEGGIVAEEYRVEYVADRVNTLGRALLGVSVECARCHDHKYDPISQKDYFRLFSFFNSVNEAGQIPYSGVPSPAVMVVDAKTQAALDRVRAELATLEPGLRPEGPDFDRRFARWMARCRLSPAGVPKPPRGLIGHLPLDRAVRTMERPKADPKEPPKPPQEVVAYENVATPRQRATAGGDKDKRPQTVPGRFGNAQRLPGDSYITIGKEFAYFDRNQPFSLSLWVRLDKEGTSGPLIARSGGVMNGNRGYEILLRADGTLSAGLHHVGPDNSIEIETASEARHGHLVSHRPDLRRIEPCRRLAALPRRRSCPDARAGRQPPSQHHLHDEQGQLGRRAAAAPGQAPGRDHRGGRLRRGARLRPAAVGARHGRPRRRRPALTRRDCPPCRVADGRAGRAAAGALPARCRRRVRAHAGARDDAARAGERPAHRRSPK